MVDKVSSDEQIKMTIVWCLAGLERLKQQGDIVGELPYELTDKKLLSEAVAMEFVPSRDDLISAIDALGGFGDEDIGLLADYLLSGGGGEIKDVK